MPMSAPRGSFQIASFRGIPIRIHLTLLLVLPLLAFLFGGAFKRQAVLAEVPPERLTGPPALWGLAVAVGLFAAVLLHELAHVVYALRKGGRVRSITLMMVGGVSEMAEAPKRPRDEAVMALVGPLASLVLAGVLYGVLVLLRGSNSFNLQFALFYLAMLNLILGLFNLLPAFPLDGGRIVRAVLAARMGPVRGTRAAATIGKVFAGLFGIVGLVTLNPFLMLIAFFVFMGAEGEAQQVATRSVLEGLPVAELMMPRAEGLDADAPVSEALGALRRERRLALPVTEGERPVGWVTLEAVQRLLPEDRPVHMAREVMEPAVTFSAREDAWGAVRRMTEEGVARLVVVDEAGRMVGTLDAHDVRQGIALHRQAAARREEERRPPSWPQGRERPV
ncbi:site-2 protease family protein [Myxococcaceae bacterium GXIMD 01537]